MHVSRIIRIIRNRVDSKRKCYNIYTLKSNTTNCAIHDHDGAKYFVALNTLASISNQGLLYSTSSAALGSAPLLIRSLSRGSAPLRPLWAAS